MKNTYKYLMWLVALFVIVISFMRAGSGGKMYIEKAKYEDFDPKLANIVKAQDYFFKYSTAKGLKSISFKTYKLENGEYEKRNEGINFEAQSEKGSIGIRLKDLSYNNFLASLIYENSFEQKESKYTYLPLDLPIKEGRKPTVIQLENKEEIFFDREIPLLVFSYGDNLNEEEKRELFEKFTIRDINKDLYLLTVSFSKEEKNYLSYLEWLQPSRISYGDKLLQISKYEAVKLPQEAENIGKISEIYTDGDLISKEGVFISDGNHSQGDEIYYDKGKDIYYVRIMEEDKCYEYREYR